MAASYPLLTELWSGGAITVETPMDLSVPQNGIIPLRTRLSYRTVVQWDGDTVHRYNRQATPKHTQIHTAALEAKFAALRQEVNASFGRLKWLQRGLQAGRVSIVCGSVALGGANIGIELLHQYAEAVLVPGLVSTGVGFASEAGLRLARWQIRRRIRAALSEA